MKEMHKGTMTLGGDPEAFIVDEKGGYVPATTVLPLKPESTVSLLRSAMMRPPPYGVGDVFADGMQAEINVPPATCVETIVTRMYGVMASTHEFLLTNKLGLSYSSVIPVTKSLLKRGGKPCMIAGCNPDFNAYTGSINEPPRDYPNYMFRSAGGHVVIGSDVVQPMHENVIELVKLCDLLIGIPLVLLGEGEENRERRRYYGKAGCFRVPPYGIEYRTPSNFWMSNHVIAFFVFGMARTVYYLACHSPRVCNNLLMVDGNKVQRAINDVDKDTAKSLWDSYRAELVAASDYLRDLYRGGYSFPMSNRSLQCVSAALSHGQGFKDYLKIPTQVDAAPGYERMAGPVRMCERWGVRVSNQSVL